jgi:hypothetical protein
VFVGWLVGVSPVVVGGGCGWLVGGRAGGGWLLGCWLLVCWLLWLLVVGLPWSAYLLGTVLGVCFLVGVVVGVGGVVVLVVC